MRSVWSSRKTSLFGPAWKWDLSWFAHSVVTGGYVTEKKAMTNKSILSGWAGCLQQQNSLCEYEA